MKAFRINPDLSLDEVKSYREEISNRTAWRLVRIMEIAKLWRGNSTCPQGKQHATLIIRDSKYIIGMGYNGPPSGMEACKDCVYITENREANELNKCPAVHSEINAIINMAGQKLGTIAVVTKTPCRHCRAVLLNANIEIIIVEEITIDG